MTPSSGSRNSPPTPPPARRPRTHRSTPKPNMGGKGAVFAVQNLAGGTGATTLP
jgi:hypothetical protein